MEDESFVRLIRGIRTAHTEHRGHWCNRDSHDEEQSLSFVLRIKLANRPVTGTFSVLKRRDLPEAGLTTLSVLSHYERRAFDIHAQMWLWCPAVTRIVNDPLECDSKGKFEWYLIALVRLMSKHVASHFGLTSKTLSDLCHNPLY